MVAFSNCPNTLPIPSWMIPSLPSDSLPASLLLLHSPTFDDIDLSKLLGLPFLHHHALDDPTAFNLMLFLYNHLNSIRVKLGSPDRCIRNPDLKSGTIRRQDQDPEHHSNPTKEKSGQSEFGRERYDQNSAGCPEWTAFGIRSADGRSGVLNTIRIRIRSGFRILKTNLWIKVIHGEEKIKVMTGQVTEPNHMLELQEEMHEDLSSY
ncbi:hypothetical protein ACLOJK_029277, partial [Asimina triloba]